MHIQLASQSPHSRIRTRTITNLSERGRINLVLGSNLHTNSRAGLGIIRSLDTSLRASINPMVIARSQHAQIIARRNRTTVQRCRVAQRSRVPRHRRLLQVIARLTAHHKALVCDGDIGGGVHVAAGRVVGEEAADVGRALLEVEGELVGLCAVLGGEGGEELGFQAVGEGVVELDLRVDDVGGGEGLGDGDACGERRAGVSRGVRMVRERS